MIFNVLLLFGLHLLWLFFVFAFVTVECFCFLLAVALEELRFYLGFYIFLSFSLLKWLEVFGIGSIICFVFYISSTEPIFQYVIWCLRCRHYYFYCYFFLLTHSICMYVRVMYVCLLVCSLLPFILFHSISFRVVFVHFQIEISNYVSRPFPSFND